LLPRLPKVVGVVTSPTGAVIRDILHRIADRFPVRVIVWPVRVQGETSAAEVAAAIAGFDALPADGRDGIPRPDVVIVARGGGSLEDLWSFNEEIVVRAVAACSIPLVSAIGHETDWTLIDLAADLRAPTPTGAAEMVLPVRAELLDQVATAAVRLAGAVRRGLEARKTELRSAARALPTPQSLFDTRRQRFDLACGRLAHALSVTIAVKATRFAAVRGRLAPAALSVRLTTTRDRLDALAGRGDRALRVGQERRATRLDGLTKLLGALSYRGVLSRGYALVRDTAGRPIRAAAGLVAGQGLDIEFADGRVAATVGVGIAPPPVAPHVADVASHPPRPRRKPGRDPSDQGSLF
jgi:exodeoxyribonuclease VII large subunit